MEIKAGRYAPAIWSPSPNFSNRTIIPRFVVMHYTAAWEVGSTLDRFADSDADVSAQFTIDNDGTIYQHVRCDRRAWHAGPSEYNGVRDLNSHSVGIEFVNPGFLRKVGDDLYQDAYNSRVKGKDIGPLVEAAYPRAGSGTFYWPAYSKDQIEAGETLFKALIAAYDIEDVVSHEEIDTRGWKTDPGPAFPMTRFKDLLPTSPKTVVEYVVTTDKLNVRSGPGRNFKVLRQLARNARVSILGRNGDWLQIENGWVHEDFVRPAA